MTDEEEKLDKRTVKSCHIRIEKMWAGVTGRASKVFQVVRDTMYPNILHGRPINHNSHSREWWSQIWNLYRICYPSRLAWCHLLMLSIHCYWKLRIIRNAKYQVWSNKFHISEWTHESLISKTWKNIPLILSVGICTSLGLPAQAVRIWYFVS